MSTKPIIPWNAKKFFSNPGKYEVVSTSGHVARDYTPVLNLDGSMSSPNFWQGMREKTVIVERTAYVILYPMGDGTLGPSLAMWDTKEDAQRASGKRRYPDAPIATVTWKEEQ